MAEKIKHVQRGMSLLEAMIAVVLVLIGVLGTASFRYHSAFQVRKADVHNGGARVGSLLLETWKGVAGRVDFAAEDVLAGELDISAHVSGPSVPSGFTQTGNYHISADGVNYYATLSYKEEDFSHPRILNVQVGWLNHYTAGTIGSEDQKVTLAKYVEAE